MDESTGSRTILRTLFVALWFVLGAVFAGWQLSQGTLTDAVRKVAHIEDTKGAGDASDGVSFGGETHRLKLGGEEEDAEAAEADEESSDEDDDQATEDNDDSEAVDEADAGESDEGDVQSDEPEEPQYEAATNTGSTDEDDEDDHVGIGDE